MKVQEITIKNFKKVPNVELDLQGRSVYLMGKNYTGKSSFIQAIWSILTGKDIPTDPIKHGEKKAEVTLNIGGKEKTFEVTMVFTEKKPKGYLTVKGDTTLSPREFLDSIIGSINFNAFDFMKESKAKQVSIMKEWLGLDFEMLDRERKNLYENRTLINKEVKEIEGSIAEAGIEEHEYEVFKEKKPIDKIQKEIAEAYKTNKTYDDAARLKVELEEKVADTKEEITEIEEEIRKLQEKVKLKKESIENLKNRIAEGSKWLSENKKIEVQELNDKLKKALKFNEKVDKIDKVRDQMKRLENKRQLSKEHTEQIKSIDEQKLKAIEEAEFPIEGMGMDPEGTMLTLNGVPFDETSLSTSEIMEASIKIMAAMAGEMKICRVPNSNLYDEEHLAQVLESLEKQGFQYFVEQVASNPELEIKIIEE